ncbi:MAG: thioredoxin family protein [Sulfurospirillaceae bacterium]|nr:thioredoxin family protein [Sulfurospirillaceae bacterium]MCK9545671.1 thioredoxin family protein [Sulfurospirillaceae bacterium]
MKIEILGTGCDKCKKLKDATMEALSKLDGFHEVVSVDDVLEILEYEVLQTPALVVDGKVKSFGKVLSSSEILKILREDE